MIPPTDHKKVFPGPETNLAKIIAGSDYRQKFHKNLKTWNPMISFLYRIGLLPLFGISKTVMLLITKGVKSGKIRYTPIGYFPIGGVNHLISAWGKNTAWYRNITKYPDQVWIQIGLKRTAVQPVELSDPIEIEQTLEQFIRESPAAANYLLGWDPEVDQMESSDFSTIINRVLIMRFVDRKQTASPS